MNQKKKIKHLIRLFRVLYRACPQEDRDDASWGMEVGVLISCDDAYFIADILKRFLVISGEKEKQV